MVSADVAPAAPRRTLIQWFLGTVQAGVPASQLAAALKGKRGESWLDWLKRTTTSLGWDFDEVAASPAEVGSDRDAWWVTCVSSEPERWVVLAGARGEPARASVIEGHSARDVPLNAGSLAKELDVDRASELTWLRLTPALPLQSLRSSGEEGGLSPFERLKRWTRLERKTVWAVVAYSAIIGVVSLALPLAVQSLVNLLAFGRVLQPLIVISAALLLVLSLAAGLRVLEVYIVELLQRRAFTDVSRDIARRLPAATPDAAGKWGLTEKINRFFDIVGLQKAGASLLLSATEIVMSTIAGLLILAFYHPYLLVFDLVLIAFLVFVVFRLGRRGVETAVEESHAKYELAAWLESLARQQRRFLSPRGAQWSASETDRLAVDWLGRRDTHFLIVLRQTIGFAALQAVASATLLGLGSFLVWSRQLTLGQLVASELIITGVLAQLAKFGKHVESFYDLNASVDKLGVLVDLDTEPPTGELLEAREDGMSVELVDLELEGQPCSLVAEPGERVGISNLPHPHRVLLFDLLYGARRIERGRALVDGVRLSALAPRALRSQISLVRGPMPVGASLEDNLTSNDGGSTAEELRTLLARVGLGDLVSTLADGLQTWIYPSGEPLDYDQLVALEIARTLRDRPRLILIDGALDRLHPRYREPIWRALTDDDARWTVLVASSLPELLAPCSRIYRWADGGLQEQPRGLPR